MQSCVFIAEDPLVSISNLSAPPSAIIVANSSTVVALDKEGNFHKVIFSPATGETVTGIAWSWTNNEVLVSVNRAPTDLVYGISAIDGSTRIVISDSAIGQNTNFVGLVQLKNDGDILVHENTTAERFDQYGVRETSGWPKNISNQYARQYYPTMAGGFIACSANTDIVRVYDDNGTILNSTNSGIAGTTNSYGCAELDDGTIAVSWEGTTDTIRLYDSTLSSTIWSFNNASSSSVNFNTPRQIAQLSDGNLAVIDAANNHILVLDAADGSFVKTLGSGVVPTGAYGLLVVPNFSF